jgi:hypothetical protein
MPKRLVDGEGIWRSQKLRQLKLEYRSEYANLLPLAGDRGSFECDPASIWADVYAYNRPDITPEDVEAILAEFERVKLLFRWPHEGKTWGYWVGIEKGGLLSKPSERYSKDPVPDADELTRFSGVSPAPHPPDNRAVDAVTPRTGLGSGLGSGSGQEEDSHSHSAAQRGRLDKRTVLSSTDTGTQKQDQNQKQNQLTLLAVTERFGNCGEGYKALREDDPMLPILVKLTEERLEVYKESNEPLDTPKITGGLTAREASAGIAWSYVKIAMELLILTDQYIKLSGPAPEGCVNFSESQIRKVLGAMCNWPEIQSDDPAWQDMSTALYAAIMYWAFKESDYWSKKLKTLGDVIRSVPAIRKQYEKFYAHLSEDKKPHKLGIGFPEEPEEDIPLCAMCGKNLCPVAPPDAWEPATNGEGYYLNCEECDPPSVYPPPPSNRLHAIEG